MTVIAKGTTEMAWYLVFVLGCVLNGGGQSAPVDREQSTQSVTGENPRINDTGSPAKHVFEELHYLVSREELAAIIEHFATGDPERVAGERIAASYLKQCEVLDRELFEFVDNSGRKEILRRVDEELGALPLSVAGQPDTPELRERLNRARDEFYERLEETGLPSSVRHASAEALRRNLLQLDELMLDLRTALAVAADRETEYAQKFRRSLVLSRLALSKIAIQDFWQIGDCVELLRAFVRPDAIRCDDLRVDTNMVAEYSTLLIDSPLADSVKAATATYYGAIDAYCLAEIEAAREIAAKWRSGDSLTEVETQRGWERLRNRLTLRTDVSIAFCSTIESLFLDTMCAKLADSWGIYWRNSLAPNTCAPLWGESAIEGFMTRSGAPSEIVVAVREATDAFAREQTRLKRDLFEIARTLARKHMHLDNGDERAAEMREQLRRSIERRVKSHEAFLELVANRVGPALQPAFREALNAARAHTPFFFKLRPI
jgi:hypothetical protein